MLTCFVNFFKASLHPVWCIQTRSQYNLWHGQITWEVHHSGWCKWCSFVGFACIAWVKGIWLQLNKLGSIRSALEEKSRRLSLEERSPAVSSPSASIWREESSELTGTSVHPPVWGSGSLTSLLWRHQVNMAVCSVPDGWKPAESCRLASKHAPLVWQRLVVLD